LALLLIACGGDDGPGPDGGDDAGTDAEPDATTGPADLPAPPTDLAFSCPDGFRSVAHASGATVCDPWPEGGRAACTGDAIHVPGTPGCAPVGVPCPSGDFAVDLPTTGNVWYVLASAPDGGDGSASAPFDTIGDGVARAAAGDTVAIGKGRYDESVRLTRSVILRGACAAETTLTVSAGGAPVEGAIVVSGTDVEVRDLMVDDPETVGARITLGGAATFEGIVIRGATGTGLAAEAGGSLVARRIAVRDGRPLASGSTGRGLNVQSGGQISLTEAEVADNLDVGIFVLGDGSSVTLDHASIHGTETQPSDRRWGIGAGAQDGATITAVASAFEDNREIGVAANDGDASISLTDCVVRGTRPRERDEEAGRGINMAGAASGILTRVLIEDNHDVGVALIRGAALTIEDVVVSRVRAAPGSPLMGRGVDLQLGASLTGSRLIVHDVVDGGFDAFDPDTLIELEDVVVRDVAPNAEMKFGRGLSAELGAIVRMSRARFERQHDLAFFGSASTLELTDITVADIESDVSNRRAGRAVGAQDGATVTLERALFERTREVALSAHHAGTSITGLNVTIRDVRERACAVDTCSDNPGGMGLGATDAATIVLTDFEIADVPLCGAQVAVGGAVDLHRGLIRGCGIGACIQVPGYDPTRLQDDVRYVDNGTNLDTAELPVLDPSESHITF